MNKYFEELLKPNKNILKLKQTKYLLNPFNNFIKIS